MTARLETSYQNGGAKFLNLSFDYQKQFSHLYAHRLMEMTKLLEERAKQHWWAVEQYPIRKLCELREEQEGSCILIGTLFKHQVYKPSILREISEENQLAPQPQRLNYADIEDKLILEDELQRVRLHGKVDGRYLATGVVCAVLGSIEEDGRFDVEEMIFYESGPQRPLPQKGASRLLVLASGLDQTESVAFLDSLNMFQHWLAGNLFGGPTSSGSSKIVRLIVAGNSVRTKAEKSVPSLQVRSSEPSHTVEAVRMLDKWFAAWSRSLPIDVMPGVHDPANVMLPQQPFHKCMFPEAAQNASFQCVTNPYECRLDDASVVGCSGQNVSDMLRSTMLAEAMPALRSTLQWSHIAPTAPDTLACYPYLDRDPFILRDCPHVYFAGNCDKFETELFDSFTQPGKRTRLVCVPSFSLTQSVAVVDLETLDCHEVAFPGSRPPKVK